MIKKYYKARKSIMLLLAVALVLVICGCGHDSNADTIYMATWCPYSKQLKLFLNDPQISQYASQRQITFVFSNDEWPDVERDLKSDPHIDKSTVPDLVQALKTKVHGANDYDPTFFNDLPGPHQNAKLPPEVVAKGFPTIYSGGKWLDAAHYVTGNLGVPADVALSVLKKYEPK